MESFVNILSLNVGLSSTLAGLSSITSVNNVDIVLLQEIRVSNEQLNRMLEGLGFQAVVNIDLTSPTKPGTAIAWKKSLPIQEVFTISVCRCQVALLGNIAIVNIYAPSGSDRRQERFAFFSQDIFNAMTLFPGHSCVLSGDFNAILSPLDVEEGKGFSQKYCQALKDLVVGYQLVDAFRFKYPKCREYTFFRPGKSASRLDKFYIPLHLVENMEVRHLASLSDHNAVFLKIKICVNLSPTSRFGRSTYWKLNTSILEDEDFFASFKLLWADISKKESSYIDVAEWWDKFAKAEIKEFCIGFSKMKKASRNDTTRFLLSYLKIVTQEKNWTEVLRIKEEIHRMCLRDTMGIVVRSRFQQNSEEERGSIYHAAREAKNSKNNIDALKFNGDVVRNQDRIEKIVTTFFKALLRPV